MMQVSKYHGPPRKYDHDAIVNDYQKGLSMPKLREKYGISLGASSSILAKANIVRSPSQAVLLSRSGQMEWHRLTRVGSHCKNGAKSSTRLISVPFAFLSQLNFEKNDTIQGKWRLQGNHLVLELRKAKEVGV